MSSSSDPAPPPGKPPLPWRTRLLVSAVSILHSASLRDDGTVNRSLLSLFDRTVPPNPVPDPAGVSSSDHAVSDHLRVRLFLPSAADAGDGSQLPLPLVVYFHGGGFVFHSAASAHFDALCRRLAASIPAAVASVDYRLAPEHKHPAAYDDGEAALRWAMAGAGGALPTSSSSPVFLAGDSAGGNIAHHVAARLSNHISGLVLLQPFFGGESPTASELRLRGAPFGAPERLAWLWRAFLPPGATRGHEAADVPAAISRAGARVPFPATLVCVGGWDAHQDRQRAYARALRDAAGAEEVRLAEFPDAGHAFYVFEELADSKRVLAEVAEFVNRRAAEYRRNARSSHA
ncbi:probable carboxylesterase 18 [Brachypodium distachyon]|uniref:Alpha/beta hydrolase fold-3 domain-containing protein n=1 Tax=Brachypodium distachyon TaxID=15368 RepID=I1GSH8_BRADI|nr:probable carboxylesterase 18 [Brachypodium distachyon]KQK15317.1 hypothetical protein BRADI_1g21890v3 [Brachypodium distachyon]|eukprot:XP_003559978.1 probable carboxylesterase 18 [Brachypodium distachyon]